MNEQGKLETSAETAANVVNCKPEAQAEGKPITTPATKSEAVTVRAKPVTAIENVGGIALVTSTSEKSGVIHTKVMGIGAFRKAAKAERDDSLKAGIPLNWDGGLNGEVGRRYHAYLEKADSILEVRRSEAVKQGKRIAEHTVNPKNGIERYTVKPPKVAKGATVSGAIQTLLDKGYTKDASGALVPPPAKEKAQDAVFTSTTTHEQQ